MLIVLARGLPLIRPLIEIFKPFKFENDEFTKNNIAFRQKLKSKLCLLDSDNLTAIMRDNNLAELFRESVTNNVLIKSLKLGSR